ncbi:MAG: hypothetical protein AAGC70_21545 [Pseudomonadota bacterium]
MSEHGAQTTGYFSPALLAGSLVVFVSACIALAQDAPKPTFLESGDNDLIRFQMGGEPVDTLAGSRALSGKVNAAPLVNTPATSPTALSEQTRFESRLKATADDAEAEATQVARKHAAKTFGLAAGGSGGTAAGAPPSTDAQSVPQPKPAPAPERTRQSTVAAETPAALIDRTFPDASGLAPAQNQEAEIRAYANAMRAASREVAEPQPVLSEEVNARLVTICLNNPDDAVGAKAFDIRREGPPRYVADIGASACARFEPTRHTLYLWKTNDIGALSLIVSNRLDLNGEDGTQVTLDWLRDR